MGIMAFLSAVTVTNTVLQALLDGSPSQVLMFEVNMSCSFWCTVDSSKAYQCKIKEEHKKPSRIYPPPQPSLFKYLA